jgi:flagellar hook assembly protein FlgD
MITNLTVGPTRGSSVSFTYNLTADAQIAAEVLGPTGRRIRQLDAGRTTRSGINTLTWDRRDDEGRAVPAGLYVLQVNAVTENGEMVKGIRPVVLAR